MKIAIASGKGGTGKTTIATNLAWTTASLGVKVTYVDCDVEEPNGHIFLNPAIAATDKATMLYPEVDDNKCISCGKCEEICQFGAIVMIGEKPLVFPEMCHDCGGCYVVCPVDAIILKEREIGIVETGQADDVQFIHGKLTIGQVMSPPLIRLVKNCIPDEGLIIVDSPPGTSCPVIEAVKGADYAILVTEPTPFGFHDFTLAVEVLEELKIPYGAFINRDDIGTLNTLNYCRKHSIPVLGSLPDDNRIAEVYSKGFIVAEKLPEYKKSFLDLYDVLKLKVTQ